MLTHPSLTPDTATALMVLGGSALFLAGHAAFKAVVWRMLPDSRLAASLVLGLLGLLGFLAPHVSAIALGGCAGAVLIALVLSDRRLPAATRPYSRGVAP